MNKIFLLSTALLGITVFCSSFFQKFDLAKSIERGKEVYMMECMNCHMEDGKGTPDVYPPLAKADYLKKSPKILINIILLGQNEEITVNKKKYNVLMPAQAYLSDQQVSDVLNYVRNSWGNKIPPPITDAQVKALRKQD